MGQVKWKKGIPWNKKAFFVELLVLAFLLFAGWRLRVRSLYYAMRLCDVLLLTAVLKIMPLMEWSVNELMGAACAMLFNHVVLQFLYLEYGALRITPFVFLLLLELLVLVRGIWRKKRGYGVSVGYAVLCCLGALCVYKAGERLVLYTFYAREGEFGFFVKALYLLACILILCIPVFLIIRRLSAFLKKRLILLQEYSMTYTEIDPSIILIILLTLCTLLIRELAGRLSYFLQVKEVYTIWIPFSQVAESTSDAFLLWTGFLIMMAMIQTVYIRLLVKSISAKEEMRLQKKELRQLAEYNRELEKNMEDMRGIRHDIKNMFLTMGGFVDRSNDGKMKVFYEENIVPFAKRELQKNDLYVKLACIQDESLKSFLYFKIMQGIEQNVPVDLLIQFADRDVIFSIEQIDLIRILGILIDNAIEEAKVCEGTAAISLKENEREYLFSVSNTVRPQKRERGIAAGTTEKGLGRGKGLLIVERLLRKYRNVLLNSFFRDGEFVQCLRIEK